MKPRTVVLTLEVVSSLPLKDLRKVKLLNLRDCQNSVFETVKVEQADANVIQATKR